MMRSISIRKAADGGKVIRPVENQDEILRGYIAQNYRDIERQVKERERPKAEPKKGFWNSLLGRLGSRSSS